MSSAPPTSPSPPAPAPGVGSPARAEPRPSRWARFADSDLLYSFIHSPVTVVAALVTLTIFATALLAPLIAPHNPFDPATLNLMDGFTRPMQANEFTGNVYWLGTDAQGRDLFSAILYGSRVSILVGFAAVAFAAVLGITLGLIAGYRGGWVDSLIMRIADVQLSFPAILVALLIFGVFKGVVPPALQDRMAVYVLVVAIGLSDWVQYARTVRSSTLAEKNKEYVQAARVIGVPPTHPSLGTLIRVGQDFLFSGEWWIVFFPGLTLLLLALAVNLLGDWLRDALNPRLRR